VKKRKPVFTVASGTEEWQGLYVDGKLVMQDHSLRVPHLLEYLAEQGYFALDSREVEQETLNDRGHLPETLTELDEWGGK
jgi:hypothetical protein